MKSLLIATLSLLLIAGVLQAEPISHTTIGTSDPTQFSYTSGVKRSTVIAANRYSELQKNEQQRIARIFNLTPREYGTFLHYMNDTMDGYEYDQSINPNLVLAMHTQDPIRYKHYLENVARADHSALARLLKVTVDYPRIMKALYPNEMPIMTPAMRASMHNKLGVGDVVQLFCHPHSVVCSNIFNVIKEPILQSDGARLDLFFVGKIKRADIVSFAKLNNVSPKNVAARHITLNYGNDAFTALEKVTKHGLRLPYLLVRRNGKSIPVDLGGEHA